MARVRYLDSMSNLMGESSAMFQLLGEEERAGSLRRLSPESRKEARILPTSPLHERIVLLLFKFSSLANLDQSSR
jgi:hypothetical protein